VVVVVWVMALDVEATDCRGLGSRESLTEVLGAAEVELATDLGETWFIAQVNKPFCSSSTLGDWGRSGDLGGGDRMGGVSLSRGNSRSIFKFETACCWLFPLPSVAVGVKPLEALEFSSGLLERTLGKSDGGLHRGRACGVGEAGGACVFKFGVEAAAVREVPWP
jgi:hypothetical protein